MAGPEYDAGALDELPDGTMRAVDLGGERVLLVRTGGVCHAIGATCPHAGGPLAEGYLHGSEVICPWHKAAFDVTTGARTEPPAVDDVAHFPVRVVDGRVRVTITDAPERVDPAVVDSRSEDRVFAIVGTGAAGAAAAQELREAGFRGRVMLIGREDLLPYDRTLLSKYVLSGKEGGEKSPLQTEAFYGRHRIERLTREVFEIDAAQHRITCSDGTIVEYSAALVATGGVPRPLTVPGADLDGVFLLRSPEHVAAILTACATARRAVVIGVGFIGMEVAASLRERGLEVTVVAPQSAPFEKQLGVEIGNAFRRLHERQGVAFHLGTNVARLEGDGRVREVVLESGERLPADLVIAGLGITPATEILAGLDLRDDASVSVDATLRAAPDLYAAGDIATFPLRGDGAPIRVEHWRVAMQQGRVAALNMLSGGTAYDEVPVFWTIQYLKRLDYIGHAASWDDIVVDGDLDKPEFVALYVKDGLVAAVAGWDRDKQTAAAIGLMTDRRDWTANDLVQALRSVR